MEYKKRPAPDDFIQKCEEMTLEQITFHYVVGVNTIRRWSDETGSKPTRTKKPDMPVDFASKAHLPNKELVLLYPGTGTHHYHQWRKTLGMSKGPKKPEDYIPKDFAQVVPSLLRSEAAQHYGVSTTTIKSWCDKSGIHHKVYDERHKKMAVRLKKAKERQERMRPNPHDIYSVAANILRRQRFIVSPCNSKGEYHQCGNHWRVGNNMLTSEELLIRAKRHDKDGLLEQAGVQTDRI
jgi:transposase